MYLHSEFLRRVLVKEGYTNIECIFVSNEFNATKSSGELFSIVIDKLKINKNAIFHIGDNFNSDYKIPFTMGITSFWIPSSFEIFRKFFPECFSTEIPFVSKDPFARIFLGYFINEYCSNKEDFNYFVDDLDSFISFCLLPPLVAITSKICFNKDIQSNYKQILFASRDGFLIKEIYDSFKNRFDDLLKSVYLYTGRKSYFSAKFEKFDDFVSSLSNITPASFITKYISDETVLHELLVSNLDLDKQSDFPLFIQQNFSLLSSFYSNHRKESKDYYVSVMSESEREIVFDIGYSGSISVISYYVNKIVDKIYFWELAANQEIDKVMGSVTHVLLNSHLPVSLLPFEEFLSPLCGSTVGYKNCQPVFDGESYSATMRKIFSRIHYLALSITHSFVNYFGNYCRYLAVYDTVSLFQPYIFSTLKSSASPNLFKGCYFGDSFWRLSKDLSLIYKINMTKIRKTPDYFKLITCNNDYYLNHRYYEKLFHSLFKYNNIAVFIDITDLSKLPFVLNATSMFANVFVSAEPKFHSSLENYFSNAGNLVIFEKRNQQSLYNWLSRLDVLADYDSVMVISTDYDGTHYPLSEFISNLQFLTSPNCLSQVKYMIDDEALALMCLPFSKEFENFFSHKYNLYDNTFILNLITQFFSFCKEYFNNQSLIDDPICLVEYAKLFNESFWYCPKKMPKEIAALVNYNSECVTNQVLSVLIPVLLNRLNDNSFRYFSKL